VQITHHGRIVYGNDLKFGKSFSDVNIGATLIYINSLLNVGVAINQGNFAKAHDVGAGRDWLIRFDRKSTR
jgi:S-adenosylmethionine hydrolase